MEIETLGLITPNVGVNPNEKHTSLAQPEFPGEILKKLTLTVFPVWMIASVV